MKKSNIDKDYYEKVIARPCNDYRLVESIGCTVWIVQRRCETPEGSFRWDYVFSFKKRADLIAWIRDNISEPDEDAMELIRDLPDNATD